MSRIKNFFKQSHSISISFLDIFRFLANFLIAYIFFAISLFLTSLARSNKISEFTPTQWLVVFIGPIGLVVFTYLRENRLTREKEEQIRESKVIFDCIGGAIDQLIRFKTLPESERKRYINEILRYTERVVSIVLGEHNIAEGEQLCANLMLRKNNILQLDYFGTFLHGREPLSLPINPNNLLPGAPEACYYKKVMYIPNTMSRKYRSFFDKEKPYRSIISIPIQDTNREVFSVLNIDSSESHQFKSKDFINKIILPTISPLISLLQLEKDLLIQV